MKRSSTSGSLLSLSQWLHTHSSSVPSPCCPLSAGLGSPSLRKSTSGDSPMTKCLKSWTEGKSILSMAMNRRGVLGRRGGRVQEDAFRDAGMLMCSLRVFLSLLRLPSILPISPWVHHKVWMQAVFGVRER